MLKTYSFFVHLFPNVQVSDTTTDTMKNYCLLQKNYNINHQYLKIVVIIKEPCLYAQHEKYI